MQLMIEHEIPIERLIDVLVRDILAAGLPPYPVDIATSLGTVFTKGAPRDEFIRFISEILPTIIERIKVAGRSAELLN